MQRITLFSLLVILLAGLISCKNECAPPSSPLLHKMTATDSVNAGSELNKLTESSGSTLPLNDPARKLIRSADLRCRVSDVLGTTTAVERMVASCGGQITTSNLENTATSTETLPYKTDSLRQVSAFTTTSHLHLRVPVSKLDTVLAAIAAQSTFMNSRNLKLDDVTLSYLSNELKNAAMQEHDPSKMAQQKAIKAQEVLAVSQYMDQRNETRIDRHLDLLKVDDQVSYANLDIDLYEPERVQNLIIPNVKYLMNPTLGQQTRLALGDGWRFLSGFFILILEVWPFSLIVLTVGVFLVRNRNKKSWSLFPKSSI